MSLPLFKSQDQSVQLLQTSWKSQLDPVLKNTVIQGLQLTNLTLQKGVNTFNHFLGKNQTGWIISDITDAAQLFRTQPLNSQTLSINCSSAATSIIVSLWVY